MSESATLADYSELLGRVAAPEGTGRAIPDAATGEIIGRAPVHSVADLDAAIDRARAAQPAWEARGHEERSARGEPGERPRPGVVNFRRGEVAAWAISPRDQDLAVPQRRRCVLAASGSHRSRGSWSPLGNSLPSWQHRHEPETEN